MKTQPDPMFSATAGDRSEELVLTEPVPLTSSHEARMSRVLDYQARSLKKDDSLEANLGSVNSGLMRIALWLDETIEEAMESGPRNIERLSRIFPAIEMHLRVTRQVDRFAQIEFRASESRKPKPADGHAATRFLESPVMPDVSQSEDSEF